MRYETFPSIAGVGLLEVEDGIGNTRHGEVDVFFLMSEGRHCALMVIFLR